MYESFFGLRERPFELTPNPRFLFMTEGHGEALTTIQYGISGRRGTVNHQNRQDNRRRRGQQPGRVRGRPDGGGIHQHHAPARCRRRKS